MKVNNEVPIPTFTSFNHCDGEVINFIGNSGLPNTNIGWEWSFGSNINNPVQQLNLGVNTVQLIVVNLDNNCSDTLVSQVEVYPLPTAIFMANEVCLGEPTIFKNNSSDNVVDWEYTMNDGIGSSSNISPNYTYLNSGVYYPTLLVNSDFGCTSKYTAKIKINELPIANFLVEDNCVGKINTFTDMSTISNGLISNWQYSFGDGTNNGFSFNEQHQYILSGVYDVSLNVISEKGCIGSIVKETTVYDNPLIDFMSEQYCLGKPTNFSNFSIQNNGNIKKWEWGFGDSLGNTSSEHPSYTYKEFGDYSVTLTVTSGFGCVSSLIKNISIIELPVANFIVDPTVCLGDEIRFIDKSVNNTGNLVSWNWNLGNSQEFTNQNFFYEYEYVNKYDVTLTVISDEGCMHDTTILDAVEVFSKPVADFNASIYSATELNSEINFYNISSGEDSYFWDFDNGVTSSEINPVINFSDVRVYEVLLTVLSDDGCKDEIIKTINITPKFTLFIPNSFTPNGDGDNDVFLADGNGVDGFEMLVFDRWGGVVFQSSSIEHAWDGLDANSNLVVKGKYMYHISLYDYNGKLWVYNGELNLMR